MSHVKRNFSIVAILAVLIAGGVAWVIYADPFNTAQEPSGTTSSDAGVQTLLDDAHDAATNGTAQEALDAYTKAAEAAKAAGDEEAQATAEDNAATYQSIVDAEKNEEVIGEGSDTVTAESE